MKKDLISELKKQHADIREIAQLLYTESNKTAVIKRLNEVLKNHRETEDLYLYKFLISESETDTDLQRKLSFFAKDWEETSEFSKYYLQKYSQQQPSEDFVNETAKFLAKMKQRMNKEEIGLFDEYDKRIK